MPLVAVGATNPDGSIALFSNAGPWVRTWRPGAGLVSTVPTTFDGGRGPSVALVVARPAAGTMRPRRLPLGLRHLERHLVRDAGPGRRPGAVPERVEAAAGRPRAGRRGGRGDLGGPAARRAGRLRTGAGAAEQHSADGRGDRPRRARRGPAPARARVGQPRPLRPEPAPGQDGARPAGGPRGGRAGRGVAARGAPAHPAVDDGVRADRRPGRPRAPRRRADGLDPGRARSTSPSPSPRPSACARCGAARCRRRSTTSPRRKPLMDAANDLDVVKLLRQPRHAAPRAARPGGARRDFERCITRAAGVASLEMFGAMARHNLGYARVPGRQPSRPPCGTWTRRCGTGTRRPWPRPCSTAPGSSTEAGLTDAADATLREAAEHFRRGRAWASLAETELSAAQLALLTGRFDLARRLAGSARTRFRRRGNEPWRRRAELGAAGRRPRARRPPGLLVDPALRLAGRVRRGRPDPVRHHGPAHRLRGAARRGSAGRRRSRCSPPPRRRGGRTWSSCGCSAARSRPGSRGPPGTRTAPGAGPPGSRRARPAPGAAGQRRPADRERPARSPAGRPRPRPGAGVGRPARCSPRWSAAGRSPAGSSRSPRPRAPRPRTWWRCGS